MSNPSSISSQAHNILYQDVLPFWLRYGYDQKHGGTLTGLTRTGKLLDSDKSGWAQGRCAWTMATAHYLLLGKEGGRGGEEGGELPTKEVLRVRGEQLREGGMKGGGGEFLDYAMSCCDFIDTSLGSPDVSIPCGDDDDDINKLYHMVTQEGKPLRLRSNPAIFSESFAAIGHAAVARSIKKQQHYPQEQHQQLQEQPQEQPHQQYQPLHNPFYKPQTVQLQGKGGYEAEINHHLLLSERYFASFCQMAFVPGAFEAVRPPKVEPGCPRSHLAIGPFMIALATAQELRGCVVEQLDDAVEVEEGGEEVRIYVSKQSLLRRYLTVPEMSNTLSCSQIIDACISAIVDNFVKRDIGAVMEVVLPGGEVDSKTSAGRTLNPGHSIEFVWFLLAECKLRLQQVSEGGEGSSKWKDLISLGVEILKAMFERGWDKEHGGLYSFVDLKEKEGFPCQDPCSKTKYWWPMNELAIAALLAFELTGEKECLEMFERADKYFWEKFYDKENGECYGYLNRKGEVTNPVTGGFFKGPFHFPRMLMLLEVIGRNVAKKEERKRKREGEGEGEGQRKRTKE